MKKCSILFLAASILAGIFLDTTAVAADGGSYDSKGIITFTPNTDPTKPVDPTAPSKPAKPIDPTDPAGPSGGMSGPLSVDYASSLDFGTPKITSQDEVYKAKPQKYLDENNIERTGPNYVQVTDNRGTELGWKLQVKQNGQFQTADAQELTGAELVFKNGQVATASASAKPTGAETIIADPDGDLQDVMIAKNGEGAGTYLLSWGRDAATAAESIELSVPGSTTKYKKQYSTTFTWVLTEAPEN